MKNHQVGRVQGAFSPDSSPLSITRSLAASFTQEGPTAPFSVAAHSPGEVSRPALFKTSSLDTKREERENTSGTPNSEHKRAWGKVQEPSTEGLG